MTASSTGPRSKSKWLGTLAGLLMLSTLTACAPSGRSGRGPVIIYLVDTLRFDRMSAYGASRPTSPAAERLAREGVRYDAAYSTASWTRPAVASLFTSHLPAEVGAVGRAGAVKEEVPVLPELLQRAGWRTAAFLSQRSIYTPAFGFRRGFDHFISVPQRSLESPLPTADLVVEPAVDWIRSQKDNRFFLYVHVVDPHACSGAAAGRNPYRAWLPGYENLFSGKAAADLNSREWRLSKYDALVRQADDQFASLRKELERRGFWKSALVVYVADHGEEFYEHGGLYHGHSLFEEVVRIPLIVKAPGWGKPGHVVKAPVSVLDVLPSVANWAGLPPDRSWKGDAIDWKDPSPERTIYFSEDLDGWRYYGMRRGARKMIVSLNPPFRTEFDLSRDPGEQSPVRVEPEMAERLDRFRSLEASYMGGLWIRKTDTAGMTITGHISLPDGEAPYLTLADASRYPIDPRNRRELPIQKTVAAGEAFEAHFLPLDELASLGPHLRVTEGGRTIALESDHPGPPLRITRLPMSTLSPAAISEVEKQMRALGYLGGGP